jgi:hypothetical protein
MLYKKYFVASLMDIKDNYLYDIGYVEFDNKKVIYQNHPYIKILSINLVYNNYNYPLSTLATIKINNKKNSAQLYLFDDFNKAFDFQFSNLYYRKKIPYYLVKNYNKGKQWIGKK